MARVVAFYDLRPIDFVTGKRAPFDPDDDLHARSCDRCGTRHARVFEVARDDGSIVSVGEGCMALAFTGLTEDEIKAAREADALRTKIAIARRRSDVQGLARKAIGWAAAFPRFYARRNSTTGACTVELDSRTAGSYVKIRPVDLPVEAFEAARAVSPASTWGVVEITAESAPDLFPRLLRRVAYARVALHFIGKAQKDEVARKAAAEIVEAALLAGRDSYEGQAAAIRAEDRAAAEAKDKADREARAAARR